MTCCLTTASSGLLKGPADDPSGVSFVRHVKPILDRTLGTAGSTARPPSATATAGPATAPAVRVTSPATGRRSPTVSRFGGAARSLGDGCATPTGAPSPAMNPLDLVPRLSDHQWFGSGPGNVLPLTLTQYQIMQAWGRGEFVDDLGKPVATTELLPDAITRVTASRHAWERTLYPGIEVNGTIMNFPERFLEGEPFRISHAAVKPGEVTQYNAVPWQADFLSCRWEE